jgi:hypothetical protein
VSGFGNTGGHKKENAMALSLTNLRRKTGDKPPIMAIYGREKIGKTTLAAEFPGAVFIQTEDGSGSLDITTFSDGALKSLAEVNEALDALASEDHEFKTLVVDSITHLEPLIWDATCKRCGFKSMERGGDGKSNFGKGYVEADKEWAEFMAAMAWLRDNKGMTIVLIGHEAVEKVDDPSTDSYNRYTMRLHKRANDLVREKVDVLGYMAPVIAIAKETNGFKEERKARGSGQMAVNFAPRPSFQAGNRFDLPTQILINKGQGYVALAPYLPGHRNIAAVQNAA